MKHNYMVVALMMASLGIQAQSSATKYKTIAPDETSVSKELSAAPAPILSTRENHNAYKESVIVFSETFSAGIPATWTNESLSASGIEEWEYRGPSTTPSNATGSQGSYAGSGAPIASATTSDGFVIFDSDWWDTGGTGLGQGSQPVPHRAALTTPILNFATYPALRLNFEQYCRNFESFMWVLGSSNGFTTIDTIYNAADFYTTNQASTNAEFVTMDISQYAGGQAAYQLRFYFESNSNTTNPNGEGFYFWQLDDITVLTPPDNDMVLDSTYYEGVGNGILSTQATNYYTQIPQKQAEAATITFGARASNTGTAAQPNAQLTVDVTGAETASFTSAASTLNSNTSAYMEATSNYTPGGGQGTYNVEFTVASDSTDEAPLDNTIMASFDVTEDVYARDNGNAFTGNSWGGGTNYTIVVRYDVNTTDSIRGVEIQWFSTTGFETTVGSAVQVAVWPVTGGPLATTGNADLSATPLASKFYSITAADLNNNVVVNFDSPVGIDPSSASEILVGWKYVSGQVRLTSTDLEAQDAQTLVDTDNDGVIDGATTLVPIIRLLTFNAAACAGSTLSVSASVSCDLPTYSADVTATATGGAGSYTYVWNDASTAASITGITTEGTYSVTVTDADLCTATTLVDVTNPTTGCNLSVSDVDANGFGFSVMPNPNNGMFNLEFTSNEAENLNIEIRSLTGKLVMTDAVRVSGSLIKSMDLTSLASGVYFIEVTGENVKSTERLIIE